MRTMTQIVVVLTVLVCGGVAVRANCGDSGSPLTAMIRTNGGDAGKIPLILIHGHQAVSAAESVEIDAHYWDSLITGLTGEASLASHYSIYLFQYCSDREPVAKIAEQLRDAIDKQLVGRSHVILAHSMGGIVATAYMAETIHMLGVWKGKKGGDTTLGLITLATPHHGTPGANDAATMAQFVPKSLDAAYDAMHRIYWRSGPISTAANRSDLRWDNYDRKLAVTSIDINTAQAKRNAAFAPFASKLIAYAGSVDSTLSKFQLAALLLQLKLGDAGQDRHSKLALANVGLVNALGNKFGSADGLVPMTSGLFCKAPREASRAKNHVCNSVSRVRRFEPGTEGELTPDQLPDASTLSIFRSSRGFDHLDMLTSPDVIEYVLRDLASLTLPAKAVKAALKQ